MDLVGNPEDTAQYYIFQAVTRKKFQHPDDFRGSLGNGVLLCE